MKAGLRSFAIGVLLLLLAAPAAAEKRVALVIGNNAYPSLTAEEQLKRAVNDANSVGDALEAIGFEVARGENLARGELLTSLFTTANMLSEGDIAFFFYAGHGVSIDGANYLLPSDIPPAESGAENLVKASAVPESLVVETLKARGVRVAVIVLDACRNNPFTQGGTRAFGDATRGLTRPPSVQPQGVFGLYSAGFGEQALDGLGDEDSSPNSVFTRVLAPALVEPGQSLLDIAYHVNDEVARLAKSVGHDQNPAYYDQARARDVFLVAAAAESEVSPTPPEVVAPPNSSAQAAAADSCAAASVHFEAARSIGRIDALEDHIAKFPSCQFADLARILIDGMRADAAGAIEQEVAALPDPAAQYKALLETAELGDAEAQYDVGAMTEEGRGVAQSDIEAVEWYLYAAEQDYGDAHWRLGLMYQSGRGGLSESVPQAVHHLMRALWRKSEAARTELIDGRGASLTNAVREAIQDNLKGLGYYSGDIDGTFDQATIAALEKFSAS